MTERLRETPLHAAHLRLGGKMIAFAGFHLPVHYSRGIRVEHQAVRGTAGLFDVSHMGEIRVSGPEALDFVQQVTVNDAASLSPGRAQYSLLCREDGGMIDDLLVYRLGDTDFLLVVNAANREKDYSWLHGHHKAFDVSLEDHSDAYALLALQGPMADRVLTGLTGLNLEEIRPFAFAPGKVAEADALLARTGYTGEDGFELFVHPNDAPAVWSAMLEEGTPVGLEPAGLGARDLLRLEMGYSLYGSDLDEEHTPLEAGLGWVVKLDKGDFVGRAALSSQRESGVSRRLAGIQLSEKGFPRPGYPVTSRGEVVGTVTSGTMSPSLGTGIALAYLPSALADPGTDIGIRVRGRDLAGRVVRPPFYTEGSRRR